MIYTDGHEALRLRTRFLTEADLSAWMEYCNDPVAITYTNLENKSPAEWSGLDRAAIDQVQDR